MSLPKDVTIRSGQAGVKGQSDDVILYDVFLFLTPSLSAPVLHFLN